MNKIKTQYCCSACGAIAPKWMGQCLDCSAWNTFTEVAMNSSSRKKGYTGKTSPQIANLPEISVIEAPRLSTGLAELDRALGGGLVEGSVILIGGDPGIGKSTLLLQALAHMPNPSRANFRRCRDFICGS